MSVTHIKLPEKILSRKEQITTDFFQLVEQYLHDLMRMKIERYSTSDFANLLFIHPRHLTHTIKLTTGKSPCDIMEERVTDEAKKLLAEGTLSVAQIAYKFGYQDPTNFTKFFKGMAGLTPLQFRKRYKPT